MAVLTASCWTINVLPTIVTGSATSGGHASPDPRRYGSIMGKTRRTHVRLDLDNAAVDLTYASGGIPLPTWLATTRVGGGDTSYGMHRHLDYLIYMGPRGSSSGFVPDAIWHYSVSQHAMRAHWETHATSTANSSATIFVEPPNTWKPTLVANKHQFYFEAVGW